MSVVGANHDAEASGVDELPGRVNYFLGNNATRWRTNVPIYARAKLRGIYPGVDLVYYGSQRQLEFDFTVAPEADPKTIRLKFEGASQLHITSSGDLIVDTEGGPVRFHKPVVYQPLKNAKSSTAGPRLYRSGRWAVSRSREVAFRLGPYDRSKPLVIDPVLSFSTYLGGSGGDTVHGIAVDPQGNAYIAGGTFSLDFPVASNGFQETCGTQQFPCNDVFIAKLSADGTTLLYATYLGGFRTDEAHGIAVDSSGNAYVTGRDRHFE